MQTNQTMKLIMMTYPGFQDLPKGVKKMLLASETFFFDETHRQTKRPTPGSLPLPLAVVMPSAPAAFTTWPRPAH